jgi:hypothetical protein
MSRELYFFFYGKENENYLFIGNEIWHLECEGPV